MSSNSKTSGSPTPLRRRRTKLSDKKSSDDEFMAAAIGDVEWLKQTLRESRGEIHYDKNGLAPLHLSAVHGRIECLKLLIEKMKIDVNLPSTTGWLPVHLVISNQTGKRAYNCLNYLIEQGADPVIPNEDGVTPAHQAASEGHVQCLKVLIESGAKIYTQDRRGHTPLDLAKLWGHRRCARILAAEQWHQEKDFLSKEMRQLQKLQMQQVLKEIEADEANQADKQFYGDLAFNEWLKSHDLPVKKKTREPKEKDDKKKTPYKAGKQSLSKPNSMQNQPIVENSRVEQSKTPPVELDSRRKVQVVSKDDKVNAQLKERSHSNLTKVSEESADVGLHEKPQVESPEIEQNELPEKEPSFYNPNPWNVSTKVTESEYTTNLKDEYPRDEYTMMPVRAKTELSRSPSVVLTDENDEFHRAHMDAHTPLRMPKLPKDVISRALSPSNLEKERPVFYKCKTILDVQTKHKLARRHRPKDEVIIHLSNALDSPLFKVNLQHRDDRRHSADSKFPKDGISVEKLAYSLKNFKQQKHFPSIKGQEYDINFGNLALF